MNFQVIITAKALIDIERAYAWYQKRSPWAAARWHQRLLDAIDSLETMPERCGLSPEGDDLGLPIRELQCGKRTGKYRILFKVEGQTVRILHIRHGSQQLLGRDNLEDPAE